MALVIKGNFLKRKSIKIKSDLKLLELLDKEYQNLKEQRRNYHDIKTWNLLFFFFEYEDIVFCCFLDFLSIL